MAYGVLEDHYKKGLSVDDAIDIAVRGLNAAMKRDSGSGDGMTIITIGKDGYKELADKEWMERLRRMGIKYP
jgi:proteasome beta subunit